jgi:hypothetical protein
MRQHTEKHRLTTLQRQLMRWLRTTGGGVLPADKLFTAMVDKHKGGESDASLLADRFCEAVDTLQRMGYCELRLESGSRRKISIYDFGPFSEQLSHEGTVFCWKAGECPVVALTDVGARYVEQL